MTRHYTETEVVARVRGLSVTSLRSYTATRCVRPELRDGRLIFSEADVARLHLLCELGDDFDLDEESSAMVLSLIDQIHGLRRELRALALALAHEPDEVKTRVRARVERAPPRA